MLFWKPFHFATPKLCHTARLYSASIKEILFHSHSSEVENECNIYLKYLNRKVIFITWCHNAFLIVLIRPSSEPSFILENIDWSLLSVWR